jgi:hypothetical protein
MVIGPVGRLVEAGAAPLELLELVHAATTLNPSTVRVAMVNAFPANQG